MAIPRGRISSGPIASDHVVQFFDGLGSLGEAAALFLAAGCRAGDNLLIVAKPGHIKAIADPLCRLGHPAAGLIEGGRLTILEAASALRRFMRGGAPDAELFDQTIGRLIERLAASGGLRVYGEMVEILAEEGNFRAAAQVEGLWNRLAGRVSIKLFCGYSSAHFAAPDAGDALRIICEQHAQIYQDQCDLLGNWLLSNRLAV